MAQQPQYVELANRLQQRWSQLAPGTQVESEHQLAAEFAVNRLTAREAVRELERRMVVRRAVGRGTFTAHRIDYRIELGGVASFHHTLRGLGLRTDREIVDAAWAGRGPHRRLTVSRIATVDGLAAASGVEQFPARVGNLVEDAVLNGGSVHDALVDAGHRPRRSSVQVAMEMPPLEHAARLDFSSMVNPTWSVRSETVDVASASGGDDTDRDGRGDGVPILWSQWWLRTDVFAVTVHLGPGPDVATG